MAGGRSFEELYAEKMQGLAVREEREAKMPPVPAAPRLILSRTSVAAMEG
ncbi:hypothetical protein [Tropicimonas marinistellae]|nr:hypothetical protein [Tropicimonas marinistellae]